MSRITRIEVHSIIPSNIDRITDSAKKYLNIEIKNIFKSKLYLLEDTHGLLGPSEQEEIAKNVLTDEVTEKFFLEASDLDFNYDLVLSQPKLRSVILSGAKNLVWQWVTPPQILRR